MSATCHYLGGQENIFKIMRRYGVCSIPLTHLSTYTGADTDKTSRNKNETKY